MCEVKSPDNRKFGISYILLLNPCLVIPDEISSSLSLVQDLKTCDKTIYRLFNGFFLFLSRLLQIPSVQNAFSGYYVFV